MHPRCDQTNPNNVNLGLTGRRNHPQGNGADRLPPHSIEMEQGVLGCILLSPDECLAQCRKKINANAFYDLRHREIYTAIVRMADRGEPVEIITLQQRLKDCGLLDQIGGIPYLSQLQDTVPSAANLSYYLDIVFEKWELRRVAQTCTEVAGGIYDYSGPIEDLKYSVHNYLADKFSNGPSAERLEGRLFDAAKPPPEPVTVYTIGTTGICTSGNITTVSGQSKHGKSAALSAMLAATFAGENSDCLGFKSNNPKGHAVVAIDTEQSKYDHHQLITRSIARAGVKAKPDWLLPYWLTGLEIEEIRGLIRPFVQAAVKQFGGVLALFLDGVAECVHDVNDPAESNAFVAELHALAIEFNCVVVGMIHLNPGSDFKTRGHLGSQLERKAETNLKLEKDADEIVTLYADKNRRAPIPKNTGPRFAWSHEAGMHVSLASRGSAKREAEKGELQLLAEAVFSAAQKSALRYRELVRFVVSEDEVSEPTAKRRVSQMIETGIIRKELVGLYALNA